MLFTIWSFVYFQGGYEQFVNLQGLKSLDNMHMIETDHRVVYRDFMVDRQFD